MTTYQPGDLLLVAFPFSTPGQAKNRPALVLLDTGDGDFVAARATTQLQQTPWDIALTEWQHAGLLSPSTVRLHKLATLAKSLVRRSLGHLQPADQQQVAVALQRLLVGW